MPGKSSEQGRFLAELRSSGASGIHGKKSRDRANTEREAIEGEYAAEPWLTVEAPAGTLYPAPGLAELLAHEEPEFYDDEVF